jgi:inorganic pyrophosphatase
VPGLDPLAQLPDRPEVVIEAPRFSFVKRRSDGRIDFVSPLPCPYNYGSIPGRVSEDGDDLDAIVLGPRLARGARVSAPVVAIVDFLDGGRADPKVVCSERPLTRGQRAGLAGFFRAYAVAKRALAWTRGQSRATRFRGWA